LLIHGGVVVKEFSMSDESSDDDCYGPTLPPHLQPQKVIGPQLPASLVKQNDSNRKEAGSDDDKETSEINSETVGVELKAPPGITEEESDGEDDDTIGPYPPNDPRSQRLPKSSLATPSATTPKLKREEWMLIPPKNKTISEVVGQVGLTSRKFLGRTPDEVKPPEEEQGEVDFLESAKAEFEEKCAQDRDERMDAMLQEASSGKTKESLLHLHRKRRKVADEQPTERRPFDRDIDLKVSGLSEEDKEKFIKKTAELTSRFRGGKQKFL